MVLLNEWICCEEPREGTLGFGGKTMNKNAWTAFCLGTLSNQIQPWTNQLAHYSCWWMVSIPRLYVGRHLNDFNIHRLKIQIARHPLRGSSKVKAKFSGRHAALPLLVMVVVGGRLNISKHSRRFPTHYYGLDQLLPSGVLEFSGSLQNIILLAFPLPLLTILIGLSLPHLFLILVYFLSRFVFP